MEKAPQREKETAGKLPRGAPNSLFSLSTNEKLTAARPRVSSGFNLRDNNSGVDSLPCTSFTLYVATIMTKMVLVSNTLVVPEPKEC